MTSDSTTNVVGQDMNITFTTDATYEGVITDVTVDGVSATGKYTVANGQIKLDKSLFASAKTYAIAVKATGYADGTVNQAVNSVAPAMTADSTANVVGQDMDITFTTDATYEGIITDVTVDGVSATGKYTVTNRQIKLDKSLFASAKTYAIAVKATGYADGTVNQVVN